VELGRYVRQDLFFVLAFQPQGGSSGGSSGALDRFGVRLEYRPNPRYTIETFFEDRFLRAPAHGFQDVALNSRKILGLFMFTEWGY
jgi:hypothetical protein